MSVIQFKYGLSMYYIKNEALLHGHWYELLFEARDFKRKQQIIYCYSCGAISTEHSSSN